MAKQKHDIYTVREFTDIRWAVVDQGGFPVASGMTEQAAIRVAVLFNEIAPDINLHTAGWGS